MSFTLLPLSTIPHAHVELLLDRAFGSHRHGRTAYRLRAGTSAIDPLSFAAIGKDGALLGAVQCWPICIESDAARRSMVLVGPVAVEPDRQGRGIGRALMRQALVEADRSDRPGFDLLMLIGDPDFYGRFFGFSAAGTGGWSLPGPVERHRLLLRARAGTLVPASGMLGPDPPARDPFPLGSG